MVVAVATAAHAFMTELSVPPQSGSWRHVSPSGQPRAPGRTATQPRGARRTATPGRTAMPAPARYPARPVLVTALPDGRDSGRRGPRTAGGPVLPRGATARRSGTWRPG